MTLNICKTAAKMKDWNLPRLAIKSVPIDSYGLRDHYPTCPMLVSVL
jgi:hypothetical protein